MCYFSNRRRVSGLATNLTNVELLFPRDFRPNPTLSKCLKRKRTAYASNTTNVPFTECLIFEKMGAVKERHNENN